MPCAITLFSKSFGLLFGLSFNFDFLAILAVNNSTGVMFTTDQCTTNQFNINVSYFNPPTPSLGKGIKKLSRVIYTYRSHSAFYLFQGDELNRGNGDLHNYPICSNNIICSTVPYSVYDLIYYLVYH